MFWAEYQVNYGDIRIYSNVSGRFDSKEELLDYLATKVPSGNGRMYLTVYKNEVPIHKLIAMEKVKCKQE